MHLVDTTMFFALEGGGVRRYLLAKRDWLGRHTTIRHTILAPGGSDSISTGGVVTVKSLPMFFSSGYRFPIRLARWRRQIIDLNPDLIEAGDPYGPAWAALKAGRQLGVPVVGFYHSDLVRLVQIRFGNGGERAGIQYVRRLYQGFDAVVAPSRFTCEKLQMLGIERVVRQPLGVDTKIFHPARRDPRLRQQLGLAEDARLLVFAGRFAREKNLPVLLAALKRLGKPYHLLLVGSGAPVKPQPNLTVYPYQTSDEKLARLIASCDALIHAGQQETFGLVVLEAMACGLPVVAMQQGAVAELIDDSYGIAVRTATGKAFAEAIEALYARDLAMLGRRAREVAESTYGWGPVMHSLLGFYRSQLAPAYTEVREAPAREEVYVCR